jgi:hypothetical protein
MEVIMYNIPGYSDYKLTDDYKIIGKEGKQLSFSSTGKHLYCNVYINGKSNLLYLHRAIALVHVDGYFEGAWVDHIDDDSSNNDPSNLQWVFPLENHNKNKERKTRTRTKISKTKRLNRLISLYEERVVKLKSQLALL